MSKVKATYHIVFGTKKRMQTITPEHRKELYAYMFGIFKAHKCYVHRINGMAEHIHVLFDLSPTVALADIVKSIKQSSSLWLKANEKFPHFQGWGRGYYGFTLSAEHIESAINYIKNQQTHHNTYGFLQEMHGIAEREGFEWYEDDWE